MKGGSGNSEKWYRALYEDSPSMYFTLDTDGKVISINKFGAEQLGYKVEELVGQSIFKVIYEEDKEIILKEISVCLQKLECITAQELRKVRKDGTILWVKETARAIRAAGGNIVILIVCEDISDRKRIEEEHRKSEERFRQIAESAGEWIWEADTDGLYTYSSPVVEKILGYRPEEIVGIKHFYDLFAPGVKEELKEKAFETFARKESFRNFINPNIHKNGNIVILETSGLPVLDEKGNLSGYRGTDTDITEHKRIDEATYRREQEFRALVENAPDIIARFDKKLRHTYINRVIERKTGIPRSSFIGRTNRELGMPENIVALWDNALQTVFKKGKEKIIETDFPTPDGKAYFETHLVPEFARDGSVESVLLISRDITERKLSEEALRRAKDELEIRIQERTEELAKANETLQGVINNSTAVIHVKDTLGRHIMVNRQFETLFHIKSEQIKGKTVYDIFPKKTADELRSNDQKVLQARIPLEFDEVVPQDDGLHTYISIKFPLFDLTGNPYAICGISTDITERKRAEQVLLESEQRYRSLFENMLDGFAYCKMLFDDSGRPADFIYLEVNSAFERLTGLKNVAGKKVTEVMPGIKESHPELFEIYGRIALTGEPQKFEIEFKPLGIWLSISAYSTKKEYFVAVFDNITERKRAEEALRQSEERLRLAQKVARIGTFEWNIQTGVNTWTPDLEALYGLPPGGFARTQQAWEKLVHPEDRVEALRLVEQAFKTDAPLEGEWRVVWPDGSVHWLAGRWQVLKDKSGKPLRMTGVNIDITERKRAEEALQLERDKLHAVIDNVNVGIGITDPNGTTLSLNAAGLRMHGFASEAEMFRQLDRYIEEFEIRYPDGRPMPFEDWPTFRAMRGEYIQNYDVILIRRGTQQPKYISYSVVPIYDSHGQVVLYVFNMVDITERKRIEKELAHHAEELARSNAELEQFAYVAAHDLQEPLRMISIFAQLLERRYKGKLDKDVDELIIYIVDGAKHMQQMIEDLLKYSRIGTRGKPFEPADFEAVFNQAVANLKAVIEENRAQVTRDPLPTVMADASQMIELFQNLIDNAIKFRREEQPRIHIFAEIQGTEWVFSVQDNGIGISPEFMGRLFKIFQREYVAKYPGTGVGLAICRRIVERHGGRIWAESEPGKGSTFYFTIPVRGEEI